jgi:hypothetical protein
MRAERLISFEDSRVKLVFEGENACTTFGRGVRWFNAEETEGEESRGKGGGGVTQRTRAPEEGGRRKGTWMDKMGRRKAGRG